MLWYDMTYVVICGVDDLDLDDDIDEDDMRAQVLVRKSIAGDDKYLIIDQEFSGKS